MLIILVFLLQRWRGVRGNCRERAKPCQRQKDAEEENAHAD